MAVGELHDFAGGDGVGGVGEDAHHPHVVDFHHHLKCPGIEEVTDQHAGAIAPDQVGGLLAAAHVGRVHHVVVQQSGGVDELDNGGQRNVLPPAVAVGPGAQQGQGRAQPLAAAVDDVVRQGANQGHFGMQAVLNGPVDSGHVVGRQLPNVLNSHPVRRGVLKLGLHGFRVPGYRCRRRPVAASNGGR